VLEKENGQLITSKVYLIGHNGYLGSNLYSHLKALGLVISTIDTRNLDYLKHRLNHDDVVIDCSRIRDFSEECLKKDVFFTSKLLRWVIENQARYFRIGSTLELDSINREKSYVQWSRDRSKAIQISGKQSQLFVLLVPNIYGGKGSSSIIDTLCEEYRSGKRLKLAEPENFVDFLSIQNFQSFVHRCALSQSTPDSRFVIVTSGLKYEIGSIQNYLYTKNPNDLNSKPVEYPESYSKSLVTDTIQVYMGLC
jgi:nucleoside-diphosphate-sugar epimerase